MEANVAPEKIYVHVRANKELGTTWHGTWIGVRDIEYTRTDAFIDKAIKFFEPHIQDNSGGYDRANVIENFRNYIKGE